VTVRESDKLRLLSEIGTTRHRVSCLVSRVSCLLPSVSLSPCLLVFTSLLGVGCDLPGKPDPANRPVPADKVSDFGLLYATHCAGCHGADGKLGPAPPLNDPLFLAIVPDDELLRVITEGRAVTPTQKSPMPAFLRDKGGPLTAAQVEVLAEGIKKRWGPPGLDAQSLPPYKSPTADEGGTGGEVAVTQGKELFARACAHCHGSEGQGVDGKRAGAIGNPAFLALISDQALRRYIITGRSDLGMPAFNAHDGRPEDFRPLSSTEIDNLVALLSQWRRPGPGKDK
jgi:cytochrome c oxidase cbb3-type subunit III